MKKQNKPIGLIVALGVFVLAAAGINAFQNGTIKLPDPRQNQAAGEARETGTTTKDVASDVKGKLASITKAPTPGTPSLAPAKDMKGPAKMMLESRKGRPLMAIDKPGSGPVVKPKPNDSSTATQWYNDRSGNE